MPLLQRDRCYGNLKKGIIVKEKRNASSNRVNYALLRLPLVLHLTRLSEKQK